MKPSFTFSVTHTTARPELWRAAYDLWLSRAADPADIEYVLCCDERWGFVRPDPTEGNKLATWEQSRYQGRYRLNRLVWNTGRRCLVDGANIAAAASTGRIIIVNSDDMVPPLNWDLELLRVLQENGLDPENLAGEFVIHVSSGTPVDQKGLMVLQVLSRARYERLGYALYPEYESMFADDDFSEAARHDGVVVDASRLVFFHDHPVFNGQAAAGAQLDAVYQHENRGPAWELGRQVLERRRALGFSSRGGLLDPRPGARPAEGVRTFALCLSGENFRGEWFDAVLTLYTHLALIRGFNVIRLRNYTTNVYVTRLEIWDALRTLEFTPDFVLWVDDDNIVTPEQFDTLLADLEQNPEYQVMAGWSWIHDREQTKFQVSAGNWSADSAHWTPFDPVEFQELTEVQPAEVTGFPCVLMRGSVVAALDERPFLNGILDHRLRFGIGGEDLAFSRSCGASVPPVRIGVDPRVRVKHLKWMEVIPEFTRRPAAGADSIAVMLRVRNEARWIQRVVESVKELGPVVVMDDHSTDGTAELAEAAGAAVVVSPFNESDGVDERRDKNWLLEYVKSLHGPAWVLCIDGDEELQAGGVEKIRRACASNAADLYALKILYLWDAPNRVRLDGSYSNFCRQSLFRVLPDLTFQSLYGRSGRQDVNQGLHVGNAPLPPQGRLYRVALLNVSLLHYGYMVKEDRLRKYEYYNRIDPNNDLEDGYRHLVQGDVLEVPADAVLRHGGPLEVRELPASLAPRPFSLEVPA